MPIQELIARGYTPIDAQRMINNWNVLNRQQFTIQGHFYNRDGLNFRRFLEIRRSNANNIENDLNVILMFPGSSFPLYIDGNNPPDHLVDANPDETQDQIMRIMYNLNFNYIKIINLSDIRLERANSRDFINMLGNRLINVDHSIFSIPNREIIRNYLNPTSPFLLAWGCDRGLMGLQQQALKVLNQFWGRGINIIGLPCANNVFGYKHPKPTRMVDQIIWVNDIIAQFINLGIRLPG